MLLNFVVHLLNRTKEIRPQCVMVGSESLADAPFVYQILVGECRIRVKNVRDIPGKTTPATTRFQILFHCRTPTIINSDNFGRDSQRHVMVAVLPPQVNPMYDATPFWTFGGIVWRDGSAPRQAGRAAVAGMATWGEGNQRRMLIYDLSFNADNQVLYASRIFF